MISALLPRPLLHQHHHCLHPEAATMLSVAGILREIHDLNLFASGTNPTTTAEKATGEDGEIVQEGTEVVNPEEKIAKKVLLEDSNEEGRETSTTSKTGTESPQREEEDEEETGESSPRGVFEIPVTGTTDSDNNSTTSSTSSCNESIAPPDGGLVLESHSFEWRNLITTLLQRKKKSMKRVLTFPPTLTSSESPKKSLRWKLSSIKWPSHDNHCQPEEQDVCPLLVRWKPSWRSFDYQELAAATDNFCPENLIGKGGHAEVYRGRLPDGQLVAVKRLIKKETKDEEERVGDFLSELGIIAHVNHPNAACLLGFSLDGGLHLVLRFSPHGSLASALYGSKEEQLTWETRFKIALGVAQGLLYLHKGCHRRIIHRDIKASNILLTEDYEPQISDFGLAKWLPEQWNHHVVFPIEGTFGYLAPEYFMHGVVNEKTDVFAFGVLLLEIITGRRALDSCRQSLVMWAKPLLEAREMKGLMDPSLGDEYDSEEMARLISVATICIHHLSANRPLMNKVVELLRGEDKSLVSTSREAPKLPNDSRPPPPLFDEMEDYTCSRYLNDLNRHKQLALEQ